MYLNFSKIFTLSPREDKLDLERCRIVLDNAPMHIIFTDPDAKILYANPAAELTTGYKREEMLRNKPALWGKQMPREFYETMWKVIKQDKKLFRAEIKNKRKGGIEYFVDVRVMPVLDKSGALLGFVGIEIDITERKKFEEKINSYVKNLETARGQLAEEKAKMETFLQSIGDGVIAINREWNIILWNKAASVHTGWSQEEALGKPFRDIIKLIREYDRKENIAFIEETMLFGKSHQMENNTLLIRRDGKEIYVGDSAAPIFNQKGQVDGAIIVFRDISQERELEKAREEFASFANHQLRTPPTVIRGYLSMLLDESAEPLTKAQKENLKAIEQANERIFTLVNALLNASRIETGALAINPESAYLPDLAEKALNEFMPQIASKKLKLHKKFDVNLPNVSVDPKLMNAIWQNLISNAVKYTPEGGSIDVEIARKEQDILLKVADTGMGIPKEQQSKMFTKMFRADNARAKDPDGAGLGLYIVRSIIEAAGGKIWFESEENKGTAFFITLPLSGMKKREGTKGLQ